MIPAEIKQRAHAALRAAGFDTAVARELLAGPKTLRDTFAGRAMSEMLGEADVTSAEHRRDLAVLSYAVADAMMQYRDES